MHGPIDFKRFPKICRCLSQEIARICLVSFGKNAASARNRVCHCSGNFHVVGIQQCAIHDPRSEIKSNATPSGPLARP
jgi:hypothetical protein